jgi:hypothetical protein
MNFFSSRGTGMEKQLFDLKFTSRQFEKLASREQKHEREELLKVKKALEKGDMEIARIHGQVCCCSGAPACIRGGWNARASTQPCTQTPSVHVTWVGSAWLTASSSHLLFLAERHPHPQHQQQLPAARVSHGRGGVPCRVGRPDEASHETDERGRQGNG